MKKYKLEFILALIFLSFLIFIFKDILAIGWNYTPYLFLGICFLLIAYLVSPLSRKSGSHVERYAPKYFAQTAIVTVCSVAITIALAVILNKNNFSTVFDLSKNKINSLSDETTSFLKSIDQDVQIICIPGQTAADNYCDKNSDILNLYAKNSKKIKYMGALDLRDRESILKIQPSGFSRIIILSKTNKSEVVGSVSESKLTNALINLIKFKKTVYFLTGHAEPSIKDASNNKNYVQVAKSLAMKAYEVKEWNYKQGVLPAEAKLLIAGDNNIPYGADVENMLLQFVASGGKLLLINNPYREQGLGKFYESIHLKPENILLTMDLNTPLGKQIAKQNIIRPPVIVSNFSFDSLITKVIAQKYGPTASISVDGGRPFSVVENSKDKVLTKAIVLMSAYLAAPITLTDAQRNKIDLEKPFTLVPDKKFETNKTWPLGVSVELKNVSELVPGVTKPAKPEDNTSAVVVYGFSLVSDYSPQVELTEELIPLTVAQLYQDKELVSIPAKDFEPKQFNYSLNPALWLPLFSAILPLMTALFGFLIWMRRRAA